MPFNPHDSEDFGRLLQLKDDSWNRLGVFRKKRKEAYREFVGAHYGPGDVESADRVPVNFLELAVNVYLRQLASSAPTVVWHTQNPSLKPSAYAAERQHNHVLEEIKYKRTQQLWVTEAIFGHGVVKVGLTPTNLREASGVLHDAGQPFVDLVLEDDWVHDMTAKRFEQIQFAGDRYTIHLQDAKRAFNISASDEIKLKQLQPRSDRTFSAHDEERSLDLSAGSETPAEDALAPFVELWDLFLPYEGLVITVSDVIRDHPIHVIEWDGPEVGPYHRISFEDVPGNIMPLPPVAIMRDLHTLANRLFTKLGRQGLRQKSNIGYRGGAEGDADRLRSAADGEYIKLNDPDALRAFKSGGIDPSNLAFFLQVKDLFAYFLGNLDVLGGLSPQAGTLGQEQLLVGGASRRMDDMRDRVFLATQGVQESLADYIWHDPVVERTFTKRIGGPGSEGIDIPIRFSSDTKEGDFLDYNVQILPNSMQQLTPSEKLQTVSQVIERFFLPMAAIFQAQGVQLDIKALVDIIARYTGVQELRDIIVTGQPPPPLQGGTSERPLQSPTTTRNVVRRNIPGATRAGKDGVLSQVLMGAGAQESEIASVTRPTG